MLIYYSQTRIVLFVGNINRNGDKTMIQLTTVEAMEKAITKARTVKPRVRVVRFGRYEVTNKQTGATYFVTCERRNGKRFAACSCKAGERGNACYHVASAASVHIQLAAEAASFTN